MKWYRKPNNRVTAYDGADVPSGWIECNEDGSPITKKASAPKVKKVSKPSVDEESTEGEE
jgi:hypothetical protein